MSAYLPTYTMVAPSRKYLGASVIIIHWMEKNGQVNTALFPDFSGPLGPCILSQNILFANNILNT